MDDADTGDNDAHDFCDDDAAEEDEEDDDDDDDDGGGGSDGSIPNDAPETDAGCLVTEPFAITTLSSPSSV